MINCVVELTLNTKKPPFDNQKVRQAISYAIDRKFIIDNIFFGFGRPSTGPTSSNFQPAGFYTADVRDYQVADRIEVANKLLDEAGLPRKADGMRLQITHDILPYGEEWRRLGEMLQQQLAKVGISVVLRNEDVPSWLRRVYTEYDFEMSSNHLFNLADPVIGMHRGVHSNAIKQGTPFVNGSRWSSPKTDELLDKATTEVDPAKRAKYYQEVQKLVAEAQPVIYVFDLNYPTVLSKKFKDVITTPLGVYGSFSKARLAD
jgi:peptide/nickel transport system substrate-binding protein